MTNASIKPVLTKGAGFLFGKIEYFC